MADLEPRVEKLENKVTELELRTDRIITKLDMFIEESRAARERQDADMREMREKHDADMREMRQDMKEMQKNIYAKMDNMDTKIESIGQHVRNMSIVTIIGIAAMVVAVFLK